MAQGAELPMSGRRRMPHRITHFLFFWLRRRWKAPAIMLSWTTHTWKSHLSCPSAPAPQTTLSYNKRVTFLTLGTDLGSYYLPLPLGNSFPPEAQSSPCVRHAAPHSAADSGRDSTPAVSDAFHEGPGCPVALLGVGLGEVPLHIQCLFFNSWLVRFHC